MKNKFNNPTTLESGRKTFVRFEPVVMLFWAVVNPLIWKLGRRYKWIRVKYRKIRKGKYLWGLMGAIIDYEPDKSDLEYKPDPYFEDFMKKIFEEQSPK